MTPVQQVVQEAEYLAFKWGSLITGYLIEVAATLRTILEGER